MKFNCGVKSFWLWILLPLGTVLCLPFFLRRSETVPAPEPMPKVTAPPPTPVDPPPVAPRPPASIASDPVLRAWQQAVRSRDANGVLNAQSAFLAREGEYREKLMAMAKEDADPRVRAFSMAVLGRMKSPPPESYFVERLEDASEHPRVSALEALGKVGTAACLPKVDGLASSDPAQPVRAAAAQTAKAVRSR